MQADATELALLKDRLAALERRERWYARCGLIAVVLVTMGVAIGAAPDQPAPKTLDATKFILHDAKGQPRGELGVDDEGQPYLRLSDGKRTRLELMVHKEEGKDGPLVVLTDKEGGASVVVSSVTNKGKVDNAGLMVFYPGDKPAISLAFVGEKTGLVVSDQAGAARANIGIDQKLDHAQLGLLDRAGNPRFVAGSTPDGPKLSLLDEKGNKVFTKP